MKEILTNIDTPELLLVDTGKAAAIRNAFIPMATMLERIEDRYNEILKESEVMSEAVAAKAKRLALDMVKIRTATEKEHKKQKQDILVEGRAVDAVKNLLIWATCEKEKAIKYIADFYILQERARINSLQEDRCAKLLEFCEDASERNLAKLTEEEFTALLLLKRREKEDAIKARLMVEEQKRAEEIKISLERQELREENARSKKTIEGTATKTIECIVKKPTNIAGTDAEKFRVLREDISSIVLPTMSEAANAVVLSVVEKQLGKIVGYLRGVTE